MNRTELDSFVAHHGLTELQVETVLEVAGARPSPEELRRIASRALQLAGFLSLAAGVIFFIAANWDAFAVFGRFALLEIVLVGCIGVALWRPAPHRLGQYALLGAFIVTGALLALFGQTYQTGANVYELFLTWTLIGVPFVIAARWSVGWAAWIFVLNVSLALYCGFQPVGGLFWALLSVGFLNTAMLLVVAMAVNFALWLAIELSPQTAWLDSIAPRWLRRFVVTAVVFFGTWAGIIAIADGGRGTMNGANAVALVLAVLLLAGIAARTYRRREDVFPLAGIAAFVICLGMACIAQYLDLRESGLFFVAAAWLIGSSTLFGRLLMRRVRQWR